MVPPFQEVETFDRNVSNTINKNLVTRLLSSKDKTGVQARHLMSNSTMPIRPLLANDVIVAKMNAKTNSSSKVTVSIPREVNDDVMIVSGTKEKRKILEAYETKFGTGYPVSIVTRKKGKHVDATLLLHSATRRRMRPSKNKFYRVDILELHSVIATVMKEFRVSLMRKTFVISVSCARILHRWSPRLRGG